MTMNEILALCEEIGFSHAGELNCAELRFLPEVRDMCAAGRCQMYGKSWSCPPHCGSLEEISAKAAKYSRGVLVQCTGQMEDDFDFECMMDTEAELKEKFKLFLARIRECYPNCYPMAAGTCNVCKECTCPDEPCRFPDKAIPSMEASGLVVSDICEKSGLPYYYGPQTITYTSCVLID